MTDLEIMKDALNKIGIRYTEFDEENYLIENTSYIDIYEPGQHADVVVLYILKDEKETSDGMYLINTLGCCNSNAELRIYFYKDTGKFIYMIPKSDTVNK